MPPIDHAMMQAFVAAGNAAQNTTEQGRALEDLICYVFELVPGIAVTRRNQMNVFANEEVDVAFWNDKHQDGFPFLPDVILVESKNWSSNVGSNEVSWFDTKIRNRGLSFGILVTKLGITGNGVSLTAAHHTIAMACAEQRRLVVITLDEMLGLVSTDDLCVLIKTKLCDLALKGTI